jgi:hypothetical protein
MKKFIRMTCRVAAIFVLCSLAAYTQDSSSITRAQPESSAAATNPSANIVPSHNFDGIGQNSFGFIDPLIPPDPAGAVGTTQYIEWVNTSLAVFNKGTGEIVYGPVGGNTIWASMGGPCANNNNGQPIVQFDKLSNRWVIGQVVSAGPPYYFCVAISKTDDGTPGNYYLYAISLPNLPDSPRLSTWPDAYYVTFNLYNGSTFLYSDVCALDRSSMLNGQPARGPICEATSSAYPSLLPADLDSTMPPPSGAPNFLLSLGSNALNFWTFHVDFVNPANSRLTGPTPISVQSFSPFCSIPNCIPQAGTGQRLTALSSRLMYRAAYRNFGDHESLVVNHTIIYAQRFAALRWYELRNLSSMPTVFQQGTHNPTTIHRWMGNVAMDHAGDIVAGYNVSSETLHPTLRFAVRVPTDSPGTLEAENLDMQGTGSQTAGAAWGNSSSLSVDPADDCTFWFTGEYLRANGTNWNTRISSFSLTSCPSTNPSIQITSAPAFGQNGNLSGTVSNVNPSNYKVGVLLFIPGIGWWTKPFCDGSSVTFVTIDPSNNTWSAWVGSGGAGDYTATKFAAYLVPQGAVGTCQRGYDGLPLDLESLAASRAYLERPNPQSAPIPFAGQQWEVTDNEALPLYPGPCWFSQNNAFVDGSGNMHLKITRDTSGTWHCGEVATPPQPQQGQQLQQTYGYGTYTYTLASAVDGLDPNIVFGLFTWSDDPAYADPTKPTSPWTNDPNGANCPPTCPSHSELDVEFSKWGDPGNPNNAQFVVQPYNNPNARYQFTMPPGLSTATATIYWLPTGISFQVQKSDGTVIAQYSYPGPVPPPGDNGGWLGPVPSLQQVRLNLWLFNGNPPQNGQDAEVIISGFTYAPYNQ